MGYLIRNSNTTRPLLFLLVESADHLTGLAGASPTVLISKNGAAFASPAGAVSEVGNGWYKVAANATDAGTNGPLLLHATAASADPCDDRFEVVNFDPDDGNLALTCLAGLTAPTAGALITAGTGTAQLSVSSGKVDLIDAPNAAALTAAANALLALADGIESGMTPKQAIRGIVSALFGKLTTAGQNPEVYENPAGTATRLSVANDATGNRSAVTTSL